MGNKKKYKKDLEERLINYTVKTIEFLKTFPYKKEYDVFRYQLSKSSSSCGANYQESQATTRKEFAQRINICLREARESNYWFKVIDKLELGDNTKRKWLFTLLNCFK